MPTIKKLPGRLDGPEGLLDLAEVFGDTAVFELIMLCRTARGEGQDPGGEVLTILGNRLVEKERAKNPERDFDHIRQAVAKVLGFHDVGARSNFYKILRGGRRATRKQG